MRAVLGEDSMELRGLGATRLRVQGGVEGAMTQREELLAGEVENQGGMMSPKLVEGGLLSGGALPGMSSREGGLRKGCVLGVIVYLEKVTSVEGCGN